MRTNKQTKSGHLPEAFTPEEIDAHTTLLARGGSILYGLNHAGSDEDFYRVVPDEFYWKVIGKFPSGKPNILANQTIVDGIDQMVVSEKTFQKFCFEGVIQALETMFAREPLIDRLGAYRNDYFAGMNLDHMCGKYMRTIKAFAYGDFKKRRHALRLSLNLREAMENGGRFNPTLNANDIAYVTELAKSTPEEFTAALREINYFTIEENWNMEEIREQFTLNRDGSM